MPQARPNILWIFGDQHRGQALGCAGDPNLSTPHIDTLARQGVHFARALSSCPWCTPFRGSLMTGLYAHDCVWKTPQRMDPGHRTVAQILRGAGYRTHYVGKWHLGGSNGLHLIPREERGGFDSWLGYENNNSQYDCWVHGHDESGEEIAQYGLPGYETDDLTDLFLERLEREARRRRTGETDPFFAVLSVQPPHGPYVAPPADTARHPPGRVELRPNVPAIPRLQEEARRDLAGYYAQIENLDANLGRVRATLDRLGLAEDTIIVFFSDHGDMHNSHGMREKSSPWEESIRIPFIIGGQVPYREHRFCRTDAPLTSVDILPTTLGLAGVPVPAELPGFDYSGYWRRDTAVPLPDEPDSAYLQHLVRKKQNTSIDRPWRAVVTRDGWKYACLPNAPLGMYDLNEDPYELHNMIFVRRYLEQRIRLQELLASWIERTGDSFELPEI